MICMIEVVSGPAKGMRICLRENEQLQVGRQSTAGLSIPTDPLLSRSHLLIEGIDGRFRARDLGSSNGTFLNRAGIKSVELLDGDQLQVGSSMLSLRLLPDFEQPPTMANARPEELSPVSIPVDPAPTRIINLSERLARECSGKSSGFSSSGFATPV